MNKRFSCEPCPGGKWIVVDEKRHTQMGIIATCMDEASARFVTAALEAHNADIGRTPVGKTVDVRVAAVTARDGMWSAQGENEFSDQQALKATLDSFSLYRGPLATYIITARLPVPEPQEVAASVERKGHVSNEDE